MPDLATLGIAIDNSQIGPANTGLAALTATGVGTEAQMKRVAQASAVQAAQLRNLNTALAQQKTAQAATKDVLTEVDPLMKKLSDGTSSWTIGMQKLAGQQKAVAEGAEASVHGLGGLERVLSGVVAETAGANERLVSFTARFAQLGIGGPIMIAVLAGLAGVAFAISNLTEDYRKAGEAYDKYMDSLRQTSPLAIVGHQLDAMHDKLGLLLTIQSFVPGANLVPGLSDKLKETIQEIHDLDVQYKNLLDNQAKMAQFTGETTELGRAFSDLQRKFTGGQLDQQGIQELVGIENRIKAEISGLNADPNALGSTKDTHAEIDRLKGLLDQADQLLQAQTKVAGLYTKMSGAPIQQVETVLEAAAHNIPAILQGIQALSNGVKILDNSDFPGFTSEPFDPNRTPSILLGAGQREHLDPEKQAAEQHANQVKAVQDAQRLTLEIQNSVAAGLDLVGVFGDVSDQTADIIKGLASGVGAANELAKAIKSGSSGDILTAGIGVAGAIGSVLSG
ncbi:MAG TPA: hypothetical protein VK681_39375, partial [Reyranella sp.]|nr:hypothetical protein [Reyranella sp.]